MRICIAESHRRFAKSLRTLLEVQGFAVDVCNDGLAAERLLQLNQDEYDLVIVRCPLEGLHIQAAVRELREKGGQVRVLVLRYVEANCAEIDLLRAGVDQCVDAPMKVEEVLVHVQTLLRRSGEVRKEELRENDIYLNTVTHEVQVKSRSIELTLKEYALLMYFMQHPNQVLSREQLLTHLWDDDYDAFSNVIDVHIRNLRRKLGKAGEAIETVYGIGYRFRTHATDSEPRSATRS